MEFLLAIGAFMAFFLAWLLHIKKDKSKADYALSLLFLVNGLTILLGFLEIINRKAGYPFAFILHTSTPPILLHGPLMWLYVSYLTRPKFRPKPVHLLHLLPFALVLMLFVFKNYMLPAEQRIAQEDSEAFRQQLMFPIVVLMIFASTQSYYWFSWVQLRRHRKALERYFGNLDQKDPLWLRHLLIGAVIFYAAISLLYITDYLFNLMPYGSLQITGYLFAAVYTIYLGYHGFRQGDVFTQANVEVALETLVGETPGEPAPEQKEVLALQSLMDREKPYTNPELTLAQLARAAGMTPARLSALLNRQLGMNFFEFVNRQRVEEFMLQSQTEEGRKFSLMGIAYNCGFNSKPTFNRVFRSLTGKTPSEWLAEQKK
ncbi:MAG TPA: helix-turn-helix transcriptional regulator [Bacteroidales bacterium]|nr:helix-turn-helix transcriptional regulator [Bacteroidales bacterium]